MSLVFRAFLETLVTPARPVLRELRVSLVFQAIPATLVTPAPLDLRALLDLRESMALTAYRPRLRSL